MHTTGSIVARLGFDAAAWKCQARDAFIGWSVGQREQCLHLAVNNARFLILSPGYAVAIWPRPPWRAPPREGLGDDWQQRYGHRPVLLETFAEQPRFRGTVYQAANWHRVGGNPGLGQARHPSSGSIT